MLQTVAAAERGVHWGSEPGLVCGQIVGRDSTILFLHVPGDELGRASCVKLVGASGGDALERCGQVALDEPIAGLPCCPVGPGEGRDRFGEVGQPGAIISMACFCVLLFA